MHARKCVRTHETRETEKENLSEKGYGGRVEVADQQILLMLGKIGRSASGHKDPWPPSVPSLPSSEPA